MYDVDSSPAACAKVVLEKDAMLVKWYASMADDGPAANWTRLTYYVCCAFVAGIKCDTPQWLCCQYKLFISLCGNNKDDTMHMLNLSTHTRQVSVRPASQMVNEFLLVCLFVCLLVYFVLCFIACFLVCVLACLLACLLSCLLAC